MKKYSIFDKIAVILAWVLVQTVIGIAATHLMRLCTNDLSFISVCIIQFVACYYWSDKMVGEVRKVFNF